MKRCFIPDPSFRIPLSPSATASTSIAVGITPAGLPGNIGRFGRHGELEQKRVTIVVATVIITGR